MGGDMYNPVVEAVLGELKRRDIVAATLRFQFGHNLSESLREATAALELLQSQVGVQELVCVGYSYGAAVLAKLLTETECSLSGASLIAPPLEMGFDYKLPTLSQHVDAGLALRLVAGTDDEYCSEASLRGVHRDLLNLCNVASTRQPSLRIIEGADHFFNSRKHLEEVSAAALEVVQAPRAPL